MTYAKPSTLVIRTPKTALFKIGSTVIGQLRSVEYTNAVTVEERDYPRVGDDEKLKIEQSRTDDNKYSMELYEKGLDQLEIQLALGFTITELVGTTIKLSDKTISTATIEIYPTNVSGAVLEETYTITGMKPREWSVKLDSSSGDFIHTFSGVHTSFGFPGQGGT